MKINPKSTIVIPIGAGVMISGIVDDFDNGLAGIVYRALPDDLVGKGELGEPLTAEQIARVEELEDAPTLFLHAASPEALLLLAQQADDIAGAWVTHLGEPTDPVEEIKAAFTEVARVIRNADTRGLTPAQVEQVNIYREFNFRNLQHLFDNLGESEPLDLRDDTPIPLHDKDTLLAAAEMVRTVNTWGLSPTQAAAVEKFREHTVKNLLFMAGEEAE